MILFFKTPKDVIIATETEHQLSEQEAQALATLVEERDKKLPAKWKAKGNSLASLCGVKPLK